MERESAPFRSQGRRRAMVSSGTSRWRSLGHMGTLELTANVSCLLQSQPRGVNGAAKLKTPRIDSHCLFDSVLDTLLTYRTVRRALSAIMFQLVVGTVSNRLLSI